MYETTRLHILEESSNLSFRLEDSLVSSRGVAGVLNLRRLRAIFYIVFWIWYIGSCTKFGIWIMTANLKGLDRGSAANQLILEKEHPDLTEYRRLSEKTSSKRKTLQHILK
jgi:hypothetical protein